MKICELCKFFLKPEDFADTGFCRKSPPVVIPAPAGSHTGQFGHITRFPVVSPDDWCGEWKDSGAHYG